jgi:hypothetical protein
MTKISAAQTRLLRMRSQRLRQHDQASNSAVERVVHDVCGLQAQDLTAASLSLRARSYGLTAEDVEQARQVERSIVWTWGPRGTLHLIATEDFHWMIPLLGPRFIAGNRSRYRQLGLDEETLRAGSEVIQQALAAKGRLTRAEIKEELEAKGVRGEGQRLPHLIAYNALQAFICHGVDKEGEATYVLAEGWIGRGQPMPRELALAELARRYLAAYAPAGLHDLAAWAGISLEDARLGLLQIADEIIQVEAATGQAYLLKSQADWLEEPPPEVPPTVRLLPYFDTYLMGYASRELMVDPADWKRINAGGGMLHPTLLVNGRLEGVWSKKGLRDALELTVEPFERLELDWLVLIQEEAEDIGRFLGVQVELGVRGEG